MTNPVPSLSKEDLLHRKKLKRLAVTYGIVGLLGVFTALLPAIAPSLPWEIKNHNIGFFTGMGSALAGTSLCIMIKVVSIMGNPEKLRKNRIADSDERVQTIAQKARSTAGYALLLVMYLAGVIGGIFHPVLHTFLAILASVFFITYMIAYWIYSKRM